MSVGPVVSIVIPYHNCLEWLPSCLDSIARQSIDFEVVLVDDASQDEISAYLTRRNDPRINYHRITKAKTLGKVRNIGLERAQGEYIVFLDADDEVAHQGLDILFRHLKENPQWVAVQGLYDRIKVNGQWTNDPFQLTHNGVFRDNVVTSDLRFVFNEIALFGTAMMQRDIAIAVGGTDESLTLCEDGEFLRRIAFNYPDMFGFIPYSVLGYRMRKGSIMDTERATVEYLSTSLLSWERTISSAPETSGFLEYLPHVFTEAYRNALRRTAKSGSPKQTLSVILKGLRDQRVPFFRWLLRIFPFVVTMIIPYTAIKGVNRSISLGNIRHE